MRNVTATGRVCVDHHPIMATGMEVANLLVIPNLNLQQLLSWLMVGVWETESWPNKNNWARSNFQT